jgi:hypothetical protein
MKRTNWVIIVALLGCLVGLVMTGCRSGMLPGERVALAAERSAELDPETYRIRRQSTHQGSLAFHEEFLEREVVNPDRLHDLKRAYMTWTDPERQRIHGSERTTVSGCEGETDVTEYIVIGNKQYDRQCDGSWSIRESDELFRTGKGVYQLSGYWDQIKALNSVQKTGSESIDGLQMDVFQGEFVDIHNERHEITVWVAQKDDVIRRLKDEWPDYSLDIAVYDINDPSISIEPLGQP